MKHLAIPTLALVLAACAPGAAPTAPVAATPRGPAPAALGATASGPAVARQDAAPASATPSFDCASAADDSEKLVCADPALAALDRRLASVYADALTAPGADTATLQATQRGWVKGRGDCRKADDKPACVREVYLTRLVQLQLDSGKVLVPTPVEFTCNDQSKPFTVTYYNDLDPKSAVITWGNDQAIVFPTLSGSGARYGRTGLDFWEHQGEAAVDFYGTRLTCRPVR